ncbi:phage tail sheath family protein [Pyxidicoccus sp. 3LG]
MPSMLHPGVYVQEVPSPARSIEGSPTSTTIFVGETERGPIGPTKIKGRVEYERLFGGYRRARVGTGSPPTADDSRLYLTHAIDGFFLNGGSTAYVLRVMDDWENAEASARTATTGSPVVTQAAIRASSPGIWGDRISVAYLPSTDGDATRFRIAVVYDPPGGDGAELVENWDRLSADPDDENYVVDVLRRSLYIRWDDSVAPYVPIPDAVGSPPGTITDSAIIGGGGSPAIAQPLTGGAGGGADLTSGEYASMMQTYLAKVDDAALLVAGCDAFLDSGTSADDYVALVNTFIGYAENRPRQDLFFVGDLPSQADEEPTTATSNTRALIVDGDVTASNFAGLYWPHVVVSDPIGVGRNPTLAVPPAGYVAGIYSRTDGRRGVWKAPAGVEATLNGVLALQHELHDGHSDELNPKGVNALRQIPSAGRVIWGSRTLQPSSEWRYVPVRRTAIFLRSSIYFGIQWAVFEPNDTPLWSSLRATIGGFMETQFRNGAFAGRTSDEAYFVKVDSETTTEDDRLAGVVNILVGFAPLRPAEFVVVRLSQKTQSAT